MALSTIAIDRFLESKKLEQKTPTMHWCVGPAAASACKTVWYDILNDEPFFSVWQGEVSTNTERGFDYDIMIKVLDRFDVTVSPIDILAAKLFTVIHFWPDSSLTWAENLTIVDQLAHRISRELGPDQYHLVIVAPTAVGAFSQSEINSN